MFTIKEADGERWGDLETLFESRGGPSYCWCMAWRATREEIGHTDRKSRKRFLKKRVEAGTPIGLLAYDGKVPVGWCSIAPKDAYRKLDDQDPGKDAAGIWSIVCFFVKKEYRGAGLTDRLIEAAVKRAKRGKASAVEAYPVDGDSPSYRFMGFVPVFEKHGFAEIGKAGTRRHVMRLTLKPAKGSAKAKLQE
jgi:GNAT superfamily N-acetyltransferase